MPDPNANNNNNNGGQPTYDPIADNQRQYRPSTGNPALDAIYDLADAIRGNPDIVRSRSAAPKESQSKFGSGNDKWKFPRNSRGRNSYRSTGNLLDDLENGIRDGLLDSIVGGDFKKGIQSALTEFSNQFGFQLKDLPNQYGKHLGKMLADTKLGKAVSGKVQKAAGSLLSNIFGKDSGGAIFDAIKKGASNLGGSGGGGGLGGLINGGSLTNAQQAANANKLFGKMDSILSKIGVGGGIALAVFMIAMKPFFEGLASFFKSWGKAAMRDENDRKKRLANAQKRIEADMNMLVEEPFKILTEAAKKWEDTWDANLAKVALTQGYNKESVYALYSSIAEQLNADGLGSVIPATDVVNNLSKILDAGLSGAIAEAFAYESTWLSAAIPTEDFTSYAATYAQMASDAINAGKSQEEAIAYANSQLETFASNLLYSSRTLSGGFTTGLKDAQSLLQNAVEIAQTAKTHNVAEISGTLTAVSGVIGSVAPDLAQGLVQNIVNAAIGGNDSSIVALRSLAGINAGNTEFLRALANDPQSVFAAIFRNLANMQNMSPTNYMEAAEGLSSVFGVDMKALARVDFNQLAESISQMQINQASLEENLALLQEGEATMSTDQLRYQEINNQILENGLAYVIDSEYGRMIQEHMWDEQRDNALMENEYSVNLQGAALELLEGLRHTVANILSFLNPIGWAADKVAQIWAVDQERKENSRQIADILERGAVGSNSTAFSNLTNTSGQDLHLVTSLVEMMGGVNYKKAIKEVARMGTDIASGFGNPLLAFAAGVINEQTGGIGNSRVGNALLSSSSWNRGIDEVGGMDALFGDFLGIPGQTKFSGTLGVQSRYSGFSVGKSALALTSGSANSVTVGSPITHDAEAEAFAADKEALNAFLSSAQQAAENNMTEAEYLQTAIDEFGINNLESVADTFGTSVEEIKGMFGEYRSGIAGQAEEKRKDNIQKFIEENRGYWDYESGSTGVFQTAMWLPFFGDEGKYDTRMDIVDAALTDIQGRIGNTEKHTVISGLEEISRKLGNDADFTVISVLTQIEDHLNKAFIESPFQECLADWVSYITSKVEYNDAVMNKSTAWSELKQAEGDKQNETLLALANAMNVFSADELQKLDPQLQTNALLGEIVIILQAIMQQNNDQLGGFNLIDQISALGMGMTGK